MQEWQDCTFIIMASSLRKDCKTFPPPKGTFLNRHGVSYPIHNILRTIICLLQHATSHQHDPFRRDSKTVCFVLINIETDYSSFRDLTITVDDGAPDSAMPVDDSPRQDDCFLDTWIGVDPDIWKQEGLF